MSIDRAAAHRSRTTEYKENRYSTLHKSVVEVHVITMKRYYFMTITIVDSQLKYFDYTIELSVLAAIKLLC